tara:strand:+ start:505 stop:891 length:387 start_codon:yes stop_codon:yes gene_type:complete
MTKMTDEQYEAELKRQQQDPRHNQWGYHGSPKEQIARMKGIPTKEGLLDMLKEGVYVVTFKKLNGDERVMTCTKSFDVIPKEHQPKTNTETKLENITVWDTNAQGWRSFVYDRVSKVEDVKDAGVAQR